MTQVKRIKADELTPDIRNANRGTERGRYALETSLREYGAGRSIVIDKAGRIIAGNKTLETAAEMGLDDVLVVQTDGRQIVAVQRMDLDLAQDDKARMLAYADNRVGQLDLDFDPAVIAEDIAAGLNLDLFWQDFEIDEILEALQPEPTPGEDTEPEIDKAEELRQKWGVETGQLWQMGEHRLICGDCTDAEVVARVMGGERAGVCFTSPPYSDQRTYTGNDNLSPSHLAEFVSCASAHVDIFVVNLGIKRENGEIVEYWQHYIEAARKNKLKLLAWNVWSRHGFGGSIGNMTAMFPIEHEWIFVFGEQPKEIISTIPNKHAGKVVSATVRDANGKMSEPHTSAVRSLGKMGSVFVSDVERGIKSHPAMFPVVLPEAYIKACSSLGAVVYEPFSGSGTTIIACENLKRRCRAVEISPGYVAVALERWHQHTGKTPVLIDG